MNVYRDNFDNSDSAPAKIQRRLHSNKIDDRNFDILARQINHLLVCFDVYLESESYYLQDNEHQRSKLFAQSVKGRDRKRPFSYVSSKDIFIQRMKYDFAANENSNGKQISESD